MIRLTMMIIIIIIIIMEMQEIECFRMFVSLKADELRSIFEKYIQASTIQLHLYA